MNGAPLLTYPYHHPIASVDVLQILGESLSVSQVRWDQWQALK